MTTNQPRNTDKLVLFNARVPASLRDLFIAACAKNDQSAAQVMRKFMTEYVNANK